MFSGSIDGGSQKDEELKNILVTGGCGFIGTNFIRYLLKESGFDGRIINVDKLTYAGNPENLEDIGVEFPDNYRFEKQDICDKSAMDGVFKTYRIDTICNFAAESHVDRSIAGPEAFVQSNILGTFTLLDLARYHQDRVVLFHHVSTDEVFGSLLEDGYFTEETPYRPNSPYSATKASSDHLVRAYHRTYGLPVTISNCSNNYGPYQFPEKLIPLMIENALEEKSLPVYGDGTNVRDWLYVKDHCKAIWKIMGEGKRGETYNIGGNNEIKNIDIVKKICDIMDGVCPPNKGKRRNLITHVKDRPGHDKRYAIDFTKIKKDIGWTPQETFASGIRKTITWYLNNREWVDRIKTGDYQSWIKSHYG
jgi:dTDP-glucose 4,6-dehydratase